MRDSITGPIKNQNVNTSYTSRKKDSEDGDDMRQVISILNDQILAKSKEIQEMKEAQSKKIDEIHLELADYKIQLAQCKSSVQDLEDFIEIGKVQVDKLEQTLNERDSEIIQLKMDLKTADNKVKSLV